MFNKSLIIAAILLPTIAFSSASAQPISGVYECQMDRVRIMMKNSLGEKFKDEEIGSDAKAAISEAEIIWFAEGQLTSLKRSGKAPNGDHAYSGYSNGNTVIAITSGQMVREAGLVNIIISHKKSGISSFMSFRGRCSSL